MSDNQQQYRGLAAIYDRLLAGVDYEVWADYVLGLAHKHNFYPSSVLDLACGTGNSTLPWAQRNFSPVVGVDRSPEMINLARQKARSRQLPVHFYCQDMRSFRVEGAFDLCVLYQDGLNYLLHSEDLIKTLARIKEHMSRQGLLIFDLNMIEKLPVSSEPQLCWVDEEEMTLIWESCYHQEKQIWEIELTSFVKDKDKGSYQKVKERHRERSYQTGEVIMALDRACWSILGFYEAFTQKTPSAHCRHIFFVAHPGRR